MTKDEKPFLNTARWISAFVVMTGHALGWVFAVNGMDWKNAPGLSILQYYLDLGHAAVVVFFVVSGYLVGGSVLRKASAFNFREYAIARFARIYAVIAPAIILTLALDWGSYFIDPNNPIYSVPWGRIKLAIYDQYSIMQIIATVTSLESIIGQPMGTDIGLWSLGYEWFFYFLFPFVLIFAGAAFRSLGSKIVMCFAVALLMLLLHKGWTAIFWVVWLAGAVASKFKAGKAFAISGGVAAVCAFFLSPLVDHRYTDVVQGLGVALLFSNPGVLTWNISREWDRRLADFSFSLYVTHPPILIFTAFCLYKAGILPLERYQLGWRGWSIWCCYIIVATASAYLFYLLFEKNTDKLKNFLSGGLLRGAQ
jgi:peptidoglycan/LPS O-acetylase OafA/YrhL